MKKNETKKLFLSLLFNLAVLTSQISLPVTGHAGKVRVRRLLHERVQLSFFAGFGLTRLFLEETEAEEVCFARPFVVAAVEAAAAAVAGYVDAGGGRGGGRKDCELAAS